MRYRLYILFMLGYLAITSQAAAQHAPREFWTESSAAAGKPHGASLGHAETAEPEVADALEITASPNTQAAPLGQFLLASQDFAITYNSEPVGAFRRKRKH